MEQSTIKTVRDEFATTLDRHSETLASDLRRTGRDAAAAAEDIGDVAARSGRVLADEVRETFTEGQRDLGQKIGRHPFASVAVAAGVGALFAFAVRSWR